MTGDGLSHWQAETDGVDLLETTIGDLLDQRADELPNHEAVVYSGYPEFGDWLDRRWTYREYRDRANAVAKGLLALGLERGAHVAILAANAPEFLLVQMGAAKAGLVLAPVNPVLQAEEIAYILGQGDVQALFFMARVRGYNHLATIRSLTTPGDQPGIVTSDRLPKLRFTCLIGPEPEDLVDATGWRPARLAEVVDTGQAVDDEALAARQASVGPRDPAMLSYTSGTTGLPKGALLTHRGVVNEASLAQWRWELRREDRVAYLLPFFHTASYVCGPLAMFVAGGTVHPLLGFDAGKFLEINSRERCTVTGGVPTMLLAILQHPDLARHDLSTLRLVAMGGAPVPIAVMEEVRERTGADVSILYGQTEASCAITLSLPEDPFAVKASTVGVPLPHTDVRIVDPAGGATVPCGERGELCVRGYLVMAGYYRMPDKTAAAIDPDGWLHTGDLATMDPTGHVNIVGRVKDMVIRGGENLFPAEIEDFLIRHPQVAEVAVVGVPDAYFGEELLAVVRPMPGEPPSEQELRDYCRGRISHQKIPRYWQFVDGFPLTASGKVQKFRLREMAIAELGLADVAAVRTA